jgi:hypothetical protein
VPQGFVANRLQGAIFRECVYLVKEGVVSVDELDDVVTNSIGRVGRQGAHFSPSIWQADRRGSPTSSGNFHPA